MAVLVKGILHVLRSPPLGAVAGHQEEGVLQALAQGPDVGGVGGPGDGPSHGIAVLALGPLSDPLIQVAHHLIDQPVPSHHILELSGAGIGGLDQHEDTLVLPLSCLQEGVDRVRAHITVEGDAVGVKGLEGLLPDLHPGQPAFRVGRGGGTDVSPFDVGDDEQPLAFGIADGALQHLHPPPAQIFIVGGLWLHCGDDVAQGVDQPHVELIDGLTGSLQPGAVLREGGLADVLGHIVDPGVQPGHCRVLHGPDLVLENVKRHQISFLFVIFIFISTICFRILGPGPSSGRSHQLPGY